MNTPDADRAPDHEKVAGDADRHVATGLELCGRKKYAEAEESFRAALTLEAGLAVAHSGVGHARRGLGDSAAAIAAFRAALELDPTLGGARRGLAAVLSTVGRFGEALELRRAEAAARPDDPHAFKKLIEVALLAGQLSLAGEAATRYAALRLGTRWYAGGPRLEPGVPAPLLTQGKLRHDIEQLRYLQRQGVLAPELERIIADYQWVSQRLPVSAQDDAVPMDPEVSDRIGHVYARIVHLRPAPRARRALSRDWSAARVEDEYLAGRPRLVVIDGFLTAEAIESLRLFCLESTIWSTNRYRHGRLGSFFRDGFNCPLLLQIADELREAFPRMIGDERPLRQVWGFKSSNTQPELGPHADFAAVNVNFWLTPHEANLDRGSGGLTVYDAEAPRDWTFDTYNKNGGRVQALLTERNARGTHVGYRYNRAIIFDSNLFHRTEALRFEGGYEIRRINVTFLFGEREGGRDGQA